MIVYYQSTGTDEKTGNQLFNGEDTYPYASADLLIVADGLGGSGCWRHKDVDQRILDKEGFYSLVFAPVFKKEPSDSFKKHLLKSFNEVFLTKDYYFDVEKATKTSAYFASRLTAGIVGYELQYDTEVFDKATIFNAVETIEKTEDAKEKNDATALLQSYGDKLAEILKEKLSIIAKNLNLTVNSIITGNCRLQLLPTTLHVALVQEKQDCVQVAYFWAGDSRAYAWDEKEGVAVLNEDHEIGETMTNVISLSKPFYIETRAFTMKKPCILFNTSDGFYKGINMNTFGMENELLSAFLSGNSFEEASKHWADFFDGQTKHDDSNTMALWTYGYKNYNDLKKAVERRMVIFKKQVIDPLPDIIGSNYGVILNDYQTEIEATIIAMGKAWTRRPAAYAIAKELIKKKGYKPYLEEVEKRKEAAKEPFIAEKNKTIAAIEANYQAKIDALEKTAEEEAAVIDPKTVLDELKANYIKLLKALAYGHDLLLWELIEEPSRREPTYNLPDEQDYADKEEKDLLKDINDTREDIEQKISAHNYPKTPSANCLKKRYEQLSTQFDILSAMKVEIRNLEDYIEANGEAIKSLEAKKPEALSPEKRKAKRLALEQEMQSTLEAVESTVAPDFTIDIAAIKEEVAEQFAPRYCRVMPKDVIEKLWNDSVPSEDEELKSEPPLSEEDIAPVVEALNEIKKKYADVEDRLKVYQNIETAYQKTYKRYFYQSVFLERND